MSEYLQISHKNDLAPCIAAKFISNILKQHPDEKAVKIFSKSLSATVVMKVPQAKNLTSLQSCCNLLRFLADLQKRFPNQLAGCIHIIKLLKIVFSDNQDIQKIIDDIISFNVKQSNFIESFFKNEKDTEFFKLCTMLVKYNHDFDRERFSKNTIKALCENELMIHEQPKVYNEVTSFIVAINDDIELLIKGILNDKNLHEGTVCFDIMLQILTLTNNEQEILLYFDFFQNLLLKIWNSSIITTIQQVRIKELLKILYHSHLELLSSVTKDEIKILFNLNQINCNDDFIEKFELLRKEPTKDNMDRLIASLRNAQVDKFSQEEMKIFIELIELTKPCDWIKFESLIVQILSMIKSSRKIDKKMILLLKLETILDKNMTMSEKELLLEIIFSCMNDMNKLQGLSHLIDKFLNELLNTFATRRVWFNLTEGSQENLSPEYTINESMTVPENIKLNCSIENSSNYNRLESILEFSKKLTKEKILKQEFNLIKKITDNFTSLIKNCK